MFPDALGQRARHIEAVAGVPACGEGAVGIGVEHEVTPARTGTLVPVGQRVAVYPVLDGGLVELATEHVGDAEAGLLQVDVVVGGLGDRHLDGSLRRLLRAVDGGHAIGCGGSGLQGVARFACTEFGQQLAAAIDLIAGEGER